MIRSGMGIKTTTPLGLKNDLKLAWAGSDFVCVVAIDSPSQITLIVKELIQELFGSSSASIAYFQFYTDATYSYVKKSLAHHSFVIDIPSVFFAIEITDATEWHSIIENWGSYDRFELRFYDRKPMYSGLDYKKIFKRDKRFIDSIKLDGTIAIINDSGDGEEVEIVAKKVMQPNIQNILGRI